MSLVYEKPRTIGEKKVPIDAKSWAGTAAGVKQHQQQQLTMTAAGLMYACARQWGNYAVTLELYMYVPDSACLCVRAYKCAYKTPPGCLRPYTARNVIVTEETVARA